MSGAKHFFWAAAVLALFFFIPALATVSDNSFLNDDLEILRNGAAAYEDPGSLFRPDHSGGIHAIVYLVLGALFGVFGANPFPYYALMLVLHLTVSALLVRIGIALGIASDGALISGAVFLVAGFHFQSVAWIGNFPRLLMMLFLMLSFAAYLASRNGRSEAGYSICFVLWTAALLCNEDAIVFPLLLILHDTFLAPEGKAPGNLRVKRMAAGMAIVAVLFVGLQFAVYSGRTAVYTAGSFDGLLKVSGLLWTLANLVIPRRELLAVWVEPSAAVRILLPVVMFAPVLWMLLRAMRDPNHRPGGIFRQLLFSGLWFAAAFAPFSLRAVGAWKEYPQPRYLYLPFMGLALGAGFLWDRVRGWANELTFAQGRICRVWMLVAFSYFYLLNVSTFCFMADKLDAEAGSKPSPHLAMINT
ncbi:MAG: hypothetical protein HY714_04465 [Candidatus Omnitrophica bacterium]|nr:hypothetical protein [Candidatus Omnitrophota bacterium]